MCECPQFTHGWTGLFGAAFALPYLRLGSFQLKLYTVSFHLAMWCNGLAYAVAAFTGCYWINTDHHPIGNGVVEEFNNWSKLSFFFVPGVTALACFIAFPLLIYGAFKGDGTALREETAAKKSK